MEETLISFNVPNMVTIWIIALVGAALLMLAAQLYHGGTPKSMLANQQNAAGG